MKSEIEQIEEAEIGGLARCVMRVSRECRAAARAINQRRVFRTLISFPKTIEFDLTHSTRRYWSPSIRQPL